jgi:hypothetical protein
MQTDASAPLAGGTNDGKVKDKTEAVVREVTALAQKAITVSTTGRAQLQDASGASGKTGVPILDDPEDLEAIQQDLERLVAFLQMDNDQRQSELARKRIDGQQAVMDKEHQTRLEKIDESIKAARKAEKAAKASRWLGILGAILAVATAIVLTVATGGVAAGLAWAGAAVAVTQCLLDVTGGAEKIVDAMAKSMEKTFNLSPAKAKAWAAGVYSAVFIVLGLISAGAAVGLTAVKAIKATADTMSTAARVATFATQIANIAMGLTGAAVGAAQTSYNYDAANAGAEVKDVNRYMAILQQMLDESKEELQQILDQLQALFSQLVAIIQSKTETGDFIVENMSKMV